MLVIMAEKPVKGFIPMTHNIVRLLIILGLLSGISGCSNDNFVAEIPMATFDDIFINLDLPAYQQLDVQGYVYVSVGGGSNGIILYKNSPTDYNAYERTCSYDPFSALAIVEVVPSNTSMIDYNCNSYFGFEQGQPQGGPAFLPLRQYTVFQDGRTLTITDEPLN
jgi:hypothetical protein